MLPSRLTRGSVSEDLRRCFATLRTRTHSSRRSKPLKSLGVPRVIVGGGTNLIVSDEGFDGVVLRYTGSRITRDGMVLHAEAGAILQNVVDRSISLGLRGLETMTGIPGYLGGAIYGNAGAYGHSIQELVEEVRIS